MNRILTRIVLSLAVALAVPAATVHPLRAAPPQEPDPPPKKESSAKEVPKPATESDQPAAEVASASDAAHSNELVELLALAREKKHPLVPALEFAVGAIQHIEQNVHDYTCLLVKRERIKGRLSDYQYIRCKIRHEQQKDGRVTVPFSVYLKFLKPARYRDREVLYVEGRYHNDLIAKRGGRRNPNLTLRLDPEGPLAMDGNRYPITEIGFYNLAKRLIEVVREELEHDDVEVEIFDNAKINKRPCKRFKVTHPDKKEGLRFHIAEVYVDKEFDIPVYYAAYTWPSTPDGKPRLLEQYIYTNVKLNVGLTDKDFDVTNDDYGFRDFDTMPVAEKTPTTEDDRQRKTAVESSDAEAKSEKVEEADADGSGDGAEGDRAERR